MTIKPQRGEIWLVNLDPTIGAEIKKTRPVVIVSSDALGKLPLKLVVPITDWKSAFKDNLWHIELEALHHCGMISISLP
jgi:mRNA interferase MazF